MDNHKDQVLIKEKKFEGRYVALRNLNDHSPIADGKTPEEAYALAVKNGCARPLMLYVPLHGMVQIY